MSCRACHLPESWCCQNFIRLNVTKADMVRMGENARYVIHGMIPKDPIGRCIFLEPDQSCAIYEDRPQACREQDIYVCLRAGRG